MPARPISWRQGELAAATVRPRVLATLNLPDLHFPGGFKELKPEAIAILDESNTGYRVFMLSDGVCDGGALVFDPQK